jgi:hypothetical protein
VVRFIHTFAILLCVASLAACSSSPPTTREGASAELFALTGAHTRVVWVQGDGSDPFALGTQLTLIGLDTDDGRGERTILAEPGSYVKPLLTSRGDRIIYSTHPDLGDSSIYVVGFDGSNHRRFDRGFALGVWADPNGGGDWIYMAPEGRGMQSSVITRVRLDNPSERQEVWNGAPVSFDTFQISPDGSLGGGLFPWPAAGVADLRTGTWRQLGDGCWTALNDVGTPLFWYFDGAHRNLLTVDVTRERRWTVPINVAPGFNNPEVYHPRWSHHPRFMTMSGPYDQGGANQVRSGGGQAEIWMGRFSADFATIEAWARVTSNQGGDSYPDVWIDRDASPHPQLASGRIGPADASTSRAEAPPDRMVVEARVVSAGAVPTPQSIAPYRNALVVSRYEVVSVAEGQTAARELAIAEWAIRDARVLPDAGRAPGQVVRLTIERFEAHPELEGERLIQGADVADMPLYYAVP